MARRLRTVGGKAMTRRVALLAAALAIAFASSGLRAVGPQATAAAPLSALTLRKTLDAYCVGCHNERARIGGVALDTADVTNIGADAQLWERVIRKLSSGAMPPVGRPRPDATTYQSVIASLT